MRWLVVVVTLGSLLLACGLEDESGSCKGTMDGTYFRLQLYNADTDNSLEIRVNGRFIGSVPRAVDNGDGTLRWGNKVLGTFPVCDRLVIESSGSDQISARFCSNANYLSAACRNAKEDFCWETFGFYPATGGGPPPGGFPDQFFQNPQCGAATSDGGATFPCFDAWTSTEGECP